MTRFSHTGRHVSQHLLGTFLLLREWQNSEVVCLAGLVHNVYGTRSYQHSHVSLDDRDRVRREVGSPAERLAYLYCTLGSTQILQSARFVGTNLVSGRPRSEVLDLSSDDLTALVEICFANFLEQFLHQQPLGGRNISLNKTWDAVQHLLSVHAKQAFQLHFSEGRRL